MLMRRPQDNFCPLGAMLETPEARLRIARLSGYQDYLKSQGHAAALTAAVPVDDGSDPAGVRQCECDWCWGEVKVTNSGINSWGCEFLN